MKANAPILQLNGVTKLFGPKAAVNDLSFEVNKGEIFGFLGPNGAGKTTTIRLILDVLRPSAGTINLFGITNRRTIDTHRRIGYLSGEMVLDGDLSGRQYLNFVDYQYGQPHRNRISDLAESLHIDLDMRLDSYSRGNKQKIALIAALMHGPELLVLDEPTSGFDPLVQETFLGLIQQYQADGGTVFMSSHILNEVQKLCSKVAFIKSGSLVSIKSIEELRKSSTKTISIFAPPEQIAKIKSRYKPIKGLKLQKTNHSSVSFAYKGDMQTLLKFLAGYELTDINIVEPELEDVFLEYYEHKGSAEDA